MKKIDISTKKYPNTFALVDDIDYIELAKYNWHAQKSNKGAIYAQRTFLVNGKQKLLKMHIAILGSIDGMQIDHRNGDGLDNQRHNIRHCTHTENQRNRKLNSNSTSGYKGVSWCKRSSKWRAHITHNSKLIHLGLFTCIIKAAKAYNEAAKDRFGEFARLNNTFDFDCANHEQKQYDQQTKVEIN